MLNAQNPADATKLPLILERTQLTLSADFSMLFHLIAQMYKLAQTYRGMSELKT